MLPVGLLWLCALPLTGPDGIVPGGAAVAAVTVAALTRAPWPAMLVAAVSLLADALYTGPPQPPALWAPVEFVALTVLLVSSRAGDRPAPWSSSASPCTALPLRMYLHVPGDRVEASVLLVAAAFTAAVCAAGAGLYLRLGDHRRRLAEEQSRRAHRLDLARDLHDLVAHEVTGIVIAAQAAALPDIEAAGLRALDAMDRMVSTLRGPVSQRVHGIADLPDVVRRFSSTGPPWRRYDVGGAGIWRPDLMRRRLPRGDRGADQRPPARPGGDDGDGDRDLTVRQSEDGLWSCGSRTTAARDQGRKGTAAAPASPDWRSASRPSAAT